MDFLLSVAAVLAVLFALLELMYEVGWRAGQSAQGKERKR